MPGSMSIGGISSGLRTDDIIAQIMETARRPQNRMLTDKATAQQRLTVWQSLNTRILALKMKCDSLAITSTFGTYQATSSDTGIVTAVASATASPGTYYLKVTSRAQSHQVVSQTFTSIDEDIGTGTVQVAFTSDSSKDFEVTIDSTNNTLAGLRDAINRADENAHAVIINSGTSEAPAYKLLLTSTATGESSEFTVDTSGLSGGTTPDITAIVQQAGDAEITFGEGAGAITVTKSTNTITDLIPGLTLNIGVPDAGTTVKIDVTRNTAGIKSSIEAFVSQYNDLVDAIEEQLDYDVETGQSGLLMGSWDLQSVQMNLVSAATNPMTGLEGQFSALSSIGITLSTAGHLVIDDSALTEALSENFEEVTKLFAADMESDSTYITYVASGTDTQPSGAAGWAVDITQAARRAQVTGAVALNNPLGNDEALTIYTDVGNIVQIDLTAGMTLSDIVTEINKYSSDTGVSALATGSDGTGTGNYLTLRTVRYGSKADLNAYSSLSNGGTNTTGVGIQLISAAEPEGETGTGVGLLGLDVEGTINGEDCTGSGQILTADPADENSDIKGLMLMITSSGTLTSSVYFTKGAGARLRDAVLDMTSSTGIITAAEDSLNTRIDDLDDDIADMEVRLLAQQDRLYEQFNTMEIQLARLQQQGSYLLAQFAAMTNSTISSGS